jgi:hypothetical protein
MGAISESQNSYSNRLARLFFITATLIAYLLDSSLSKIANIPNYCAQCSSLVCRAAFAVRVPKARPCETRVKETIHPEVSTGRTI